jgi:hypothetical protein
VLCKQLGYPGAEFFSTGSYFGSVPSKFAYDFINCKGTEPQLLDCHGGQGHDDMACNSMEAAGVVCKPKK